MKIKIGAETWKTFCSFYFLYPPFLPRYQVPNNSLLSSIGDSSPLPFLFHIPHLHFYNNSSPLTSLLISNPFTTLPKDTSDDSTFQIKILYGLVIFSIKFELAVWLYKIPPDLISAFSRLTSVTHSVTQYIFMESGICAMH